MKRTLIIMGGIALATTFSAFGQSVVGTPHDLSSTGPGARSTNSRVCVQCHTPHQAVAANAQDPLWNKEVTVTPNFGVYGSVTFDGAPITDVGDASGPGTLSYTTLCLSCHDGTVAVGSLYNNPNGPPAYVFADGGSVVGGVMTGTPLIGTNLTDDHPVNFAYAVSDAADPGIVAEGSVPTAMLPGGMVQCSSCHDPHSNAFVPFMVVDNAGSALCLTCHIK